MREFKVDDNIVLIKPLTSSGHAKYLQTLGAKFSVSRGDDNGFINIKDAAGIEHIGIFSDRFELVNKYPNPPHKHVKEMIAFAEGAEIERMNAGGRWQRVTLPYWDVNYKYRIKPEKSAKDLEIERIESEIRKQAEITSKLADDLKAAQLK